MLTGTRELFQSDYRKFNTNQLTTVIVLGAQDRTSFAVTLLLLLIGGSYAIGVVYDVHIEFGDDDFFKALNDELHLLLPHDEIDLRNVAKPHVTLYMTEFRNGTQMSLINKFVSLFHLLKTSLAQFQNLKITNIG